MDYLCLLKFTRHSWAYFAVMVVDYYILRKRTLNVNDLYNKKVFSKGLTGQQLLRLLSVRLLTDCGGSLLVCQFNSIRLGELLYFDEGVKKVPKLSVKGRC